MFRLHAWLSLRRKPLSSILNIILLISILTLTVTFSSILVLNHYVTTQVKNAIPLKGVISRPPSWFLSSLNKTVLMIEKDVISNMSHEIVELLRSLPYLDDIETRLERVVFASTKRRTANDHVNGVSAESSSGFDQSIIWMNEDSLGTPYVLRGVDREHFTELYDGWIEIVSGRGIREDEIEAGKAVVLVSYDFARENDLGIGSTLRLESVLLDHNKVDHEIDIRFSNLEAYQAYELEVVGLFHLPNTREITSLAPMERSRIIQNVNHRFYTSHRFVKEIERDMMNLHQNSPLSLSMVDMQSSSIEDLQKRLGYLTRTQLLETHFHLVFSLRDHAEASLFLAQSAQILPKYYRANFDQESSIMIHQSMRSLENVLRMFSKIIFPLLIAVFGLGKVFVGKSNQETSLVYKRMGFYRSERMEIKLWRSFFVWIPSSIISVLLSFLITSTLTQRLLENLLLEYAVNVGYTNPSLMFEGLLSHQIKDRFILGIHSLHNSFMFGVVMIAIMITLGVGVFLCLRNRRL